MEQLRRHKHTSRRRGGGEGADYAMSSLWPAANHSRGAQWKQSAHGPVCGSMWTGNGGCSGGNARTWPCARIHTHTSYSTWHQTTHQPSAVIVTQFPEAQPESRWLSPWWSASDADMCPSEKATDWFCFLFLTHQARYWLMGGSVCELPARKERSGVAAPPQSSAWHQTCASTRRCV